MRMNAAVCYWWRVPLLGPGDPLWATLRMTVQEAFLYAARNGCRIPPQPVDDAWEIRREAGA
jgi:hypothetical protein